MASLPVEERLLEQVTVRLIDPDDRERHDALMEQGHYLGKDHAEAWILRYVVEYQGQWVALLTFCLAALHLKPRGVRHLIASVVCMAAFGRRPRVGGRGGEGGHADGPA